jgi:ABC-type dipeptide/oligopeptide/nickel transport system permease component
VSLRAFLLRRLATAALALLGVCLLCFAFLHIVPGDPVDQLTGGEATPGDRAAIVACLHLDQSKLAQLGHFFAGIADGSLGRPCPDGPGKPDVATRILAVLPHTAELAGAGLLVAVLLALPLGVLAARRQGTWVDLSASFVSLAGVSIPTVWMGPLVLFVFFVVLAWLPGPSETGALALLLPALVVGTHLMALLARLTRGSLIDELGRDYVRSARAKGLGSLAVTRHALANALLPVLTVAGLQLGSLAGGAIVTEKVFARPGLGTLLYEAIKTRNYPLVQGTVLVVAVATVLVTLLVDLAYGLLDPRIRRA